VAGTDQPGHLARFEIRRYLGEGSFGRVYEAYDPSLRRPVALKVAKPERMDSPDHIERFRREARAAATLDHPHIVGVYEVGEDGPYHFIASRFVQGRSLEKVLLQESGQLLPVRQAVELVRKLAEALAYAHRTGVVHRDVKPSNVMLREDGEPLLADFGLATRADDPRLTRAGGPLGSPGYMAPEQWRGQADPASDQYSLGCLFFELLTGRLPFAGLAAGHLMYLHLHEPAPSPRKDRPDLPQDLEWICLKCLEKEPGRRYADCQALADDLQRWLAGEPIEAPPASAPDRPGRGRWFTRKSVGLAGAGLVACLVFLTILQQSGVFSGRPTGQVAAEDSLRPGNWYELLDRRPRILVWPSRGGENWRLLEDERELVVPVNDEGLLGLGEAPRPPWEVEVKIQQIRWDNAGLFFDYHPSRFQNRDCNTYQVIALALREKNNRSHYYVLQRSVVHRLIPTTVVRYPQEEFPVPDPVTEGQHTLRVALSRNGIEKVFWDDKQVVSNRFLGAAAGVWSTGGQPLTVIPWVLALGPADLGTLSGEPPFPPAERPGAFGVWTSVNSTVFREARYRILEEGHP
jgi:hypothetical protein